MDALPQLTANPVADAEAREDAAQAVADDLALERQTWTEWATPEQIQDHAQAEDWTRICTLLADLANYRVNDADAYERAGQILDGIARHAVRKLTVPAERMRILGCVEHDVEQRR